MTAPDRKCEGTLPAPWGKNFGPSTEPGGCRRPKGHTGPCHPVSLATDTATQPTVRAALEGEQQ